MELFHLFQIASSQSFREVLRVPKMPALKIFHLRGLAPKDQHNSTQDVPFKDH